MDFFTSGLFWLIEGIFLCIALAGLRAWTYERDIPMPLWKWILVIVWIFLAGFTIAFTTTSLGEGEARAATVGGTIFAVLVIGSAVILWRILGYKRKA